MSLLLKERRKPNGTRDVWYWDALGQKTQYTRIRGGQSRDPEPEKYAYDANGNRTTDERGTHRFNPRGQLVWWKRRGDRGRCRRRGRASPSRAFKGETAGDATEIDYDSLSPSPRPARSSRSRRGSTTTASA